MTPAITTLQNKLAETEALARKITEPIVSRQLAEGIRSYKRAIDRLSECVHCKKFADNPIWFYDRAICPECAEKIRTANPFGMEK